MGRSAAFNMDNSSHWISMLCYKWALAYAGRTRRLVLACISSNRLGCILFNFLGGGIFDECNFWIFGELER